MASGMTRPVVPSKTKLDTVDEVKDAIIIACRAMEYCRLAVAQGHVTARVPERPDCILATPLKAVGLSRKEELSIIDLDGKVVEGTVRPLGEMALHTEVYRIRPDVGAICRFHSEMTSVFGILKREVRVVHGLGFVLGPEVPVFDSPDLVDTPEQGKKVAEALGKGYGVIIRGNGAITVGSNVIDACCRAVLLEESARLQYKASLIGEPTYLSLEELDRRNEKYWAIPRDSLYGKIWEFLKSKVV